LRWNGRRRRVRRADERRDTYFVDRFHARTLGLVVTLLCLSIADAVLTIDLLDANCEEINPLMGYFLAGGHFTFLLGKYILTAAGLPFIVVYGNHRLFGTRFRVAFLLPMFISLYLALVTYQWTLYPTSRRPPTEMVRRGGGGAPVGA